MATIKGQNLRIFIVNDYGLPTENLICIGAALSCTLHIGATVTDSTTKDSDENWIENNVTDLEWDVQTEALVYDSMDEGATSAGELEVGQKFVLRFAQASGEQNRDAISNALQLTGEAIASDLQIVARNRENSTWAATFNGCGELTQYTPNQSESIHDAGEHPGHADASVEP